MAEAVHCRGDDEGVVGRVGVDRVTRDLNVPEQHPRDPLVDENFDENVRRRPGDEILQGTGDDATGRDAVWVGG